jgi:hypothetical protein
MYLSMFHESVNRHEQRISNETYLTYRVVGVVNENNTCV